MRGQSVHVLFATVTGNAEEIARRIHAELKSKKLQEGFLGAVQDYEKTGLGKPDSEGDAFIIVTSTTGEGDIPEPARPFMQILRKKDLSLWMNVPYTVLGLGDSNYENFCNAGKTIDKALRESGAVSFYERGDADDGEGLEEVVEPWISGLWDALRKVITSKKFAAENDSVTVNTTQNGMQEVTEEELGFEESSLPRMLPATTTLTPINNLSTKVTSCSPFYSSVTSRLAKISNAIKLTSDHAEKEVWHIELALPTPLYSVTYRPGDAFGILTQNQEDEVKRLLAFLPENGDDFYRLSDNFGTSIAEDSARKLLLDRVDIRAVLKKTLLRALSRHCTDRSERTLLLHFSSKAGRKQYTSDVVRKQLSLLSLLENLVPSCRPPLALLLDQLPPLAPRWYSAASAPSKDGLTSLHFAFTVVENGLATIKLAAMCKRFLFSGACDEAVLLIPRASDSDSMFHPPPDPSLSYVMIGPGTGVSPYRGFLRERSCLVNNESTALGRTMLFFGCRKPDVDYLYRAELEKLLEDGVLDVLDVAFSRTQEHKVYVQHRMKERSEEVADLIGQGGLIFVCGDGSGMARGVDEALHDIVAHHFCDSDDEKAKIFVKKLVAEKRYVRDIWSW